MKSIQHVFILLFISIILSACGGGGGGGDPAPNTGTQPSGNTGDATATAENSGDLSVAASEGAKQAINQKNVPISTIVSTEEYLKNEVGNLTHDIVLSQAISLTGATVTNDCNSGSYTYDIDSSSSSGTFTYNNCSFSAGYSINGTITYSYNTTTRIYKYTYNNVTVKYGNQTYTINSSMTCDFSSGSYKCSYSSDFTGSNGVKYKSSNVTVSGSNTSGYNVKATITHPNYGSITIVATGIKICTNGRIGEGTITVTDSTGSVVIEATFSGCNSSTITYTYKGITKTITQ